MNLNDASSLVLRTAAERDRAGLIQLWHDVFGDDTAYIADFYTTVKPITAALFDGERAVGMINVCDISLGALRGGYIYAACVAPEHRGRGLFTPLMSFCDSLGYDFLFLIPAGEHLFPLYRHYGYTPVRSPVLECADGDMFRRCADAATVKLQTPNGYIERPDALRKFALSGMNYASANGVSFVFSRSAEQIDVSDGEKGNSSHETEKNVIKIYELFGTDINSYDIIGIKKVSYRYGMYKCPRASLDIRGFGLLADV